MVRTFRAISARTLQLLVFDLDGTLIDSRLDLSNSVNAMLRHFGRQPLSESIIASYIGNGASTLVRRAMGEPVDDSLLQSAMSYFLGYYQEHKLDHTKAYPGVFDALRELRHETNGARRPKQSPKWSMAVLTNKPAGASRAICDALGLSPYFFRIYGGNSFPTKKPDPQGLQALMDEAGVSPGETLMIGDSDVDILTARNVGAWSVGCTYGLAPLSLKTVRPDCLVDSPEEWPSALLGESTGAFPS